MKKLRKCPFFPTTYFGKSRSSKIRKNNNTNSPFFWEIAAYNPFLPAVFRFIYHLFLRHFLPIITTLWFEVTAIFQSFPRLPKTYSKSIINALYCGRFKKIYVIVPYVWKLFLGTVKLLYAFVTTSISRKKNKIKTLLYAEKHWTWSHYK